MTGVDKKAKPWMPPPLPVRFFDLTVKEIIDQAPESPAWYETDEGLPAHALDGPSSLGRLFLCPGSLTMAKRFPSADSQFSYEGTCAHKLAEDSYNLSKQPSEFIGNEMVPKPDDEEITPVYVDEEMVAHIDNFLAYCEALPGDVRFAENVVDLGYWAEHCFGSCDVLIADTEEMTMDLVDLKYGAGVPVYADQTPQPLGYALGAVWAMAKKYGVEWKRITVHIHQPRLNSITEHTYSIYEVLAFGEAFRELAIYARTPKGAADFRPGVKQCQFCPGKMNCVPRLEHYQGVMRDLASSIPNINDRKLIADEDVGRAIAELEGITTFFNGLKKDALQRALDGKNIKGYKLTKGRTNRSWKDEEAAKTAMLTLTQGSEDEIYGPRVLISPAAAEKAFGKKVYNESIAATVSKTEGRKTLVKDDDPRAAVEGGSTEKHVDKVKKSTSAKPTKTPTKKKVRDVGF